MDTITKPTMKVTGLTFNSNQVSQTFIWKNDHRYIWIDTTCFLRSRVELGKCWLEIFNGNCIEVPSGLLNLFLVEQKLIFKSITVQSPLFYSILIHLSKLNEFQCIHLTFLAVSEAILFLWMGTEISSASREIVCMYLVTAFSGL